MFIGQIILNRRKELNMTQKQLAEKLNVTDRTISRWECGVSLPDVEMLKTVAKVLEVDISYFYEDVKEKEINYTEEYDYERIKKYKMNSIVPFSLLAISILTSIIIKIFLFYLTAPIFLLSNIYTIINYLFGEGFSNKIIILIIIQLVSFIMSVVSIVLQSKNSISFKYFYKSKMYNKIYIDVDKKTNIIYIILAIISISLMIF